MSEFLFEYPVHELHKQLAVAEKKIIQQSDMFNKQLAVAGMKIFEQSAENVVLRKQRLSAQQYTLDLAYEKDTISENLEELNGKVDAIVAENVMLTVENGQFKKALPLAKAELAEERDENVLLVVVNVQFKKDLLLAKAELAEEREMTEAYLKAAVDLKKQLAVAKISLVIAGISLMACRR